MAIKSYIVYPSEGQKEILSNKLKNNPLCEIIAAENKEVIILVTDCEDENEDKKLLLELNDCKEINHMTLVSGYE